MYIKECEVITVVAIQ